MYIETKEFFGPLYRGAHRRVEEGDIDRQGPLPIVSDGVAAEYRLFRWGKGAD